MSFILFSFFHSQSIVTIHFVIPSSHPVLQLGGRDCRPSHKFQSEFQLVDTKFQTLTVLCLTDAAIKSSPWFFSVDDLFIVCGLFKHIT